MSFGDTGQVSRRSLFIDPGIENLGLIFVEEDLTRPTSFQRQIATILRASVESVVDRVHAASMTDPVYHATIVANWWPRAVQSIPDLSIVPIDRVVIEQGIDAPLRHFIAALVTVIKLSHPRCVVHHVHPRTWKAYWRLECHGHETNKLLAIALLSLYDFQVILKLNLYRVCIYFINFYSKIFYSKFYSTHLRK